MSASSPGAELDHQVSQLRRCLRLQSMRALWLSARKAEAAMIEVVEVRVEVVDEEEEGLAGIREIAEESDGRVGHRFGRRVFVAARRVFEVDVVALLETRVPLCRQQNVAHDTGRPVAVAREDLGQGVGRLRELGEDVVDPQGRGVKAGDHRGDRGLGPGSGRVRAFEADRSPREGVDVRRGRARVAVAAEMVRAQRVDHDEEDVGGRGGGAADDCGGEQRQARAASRL